MKKYLKKFLSIWGGETTCEDIQYITGHYAKPCKCPECKNKCKKEGK